MNQPDQLHRLLSSFESFFSNLGCRLVYRVNEPEEWNRACSNLEFISVDYLESNIEYYIEYGRSEGASVTDLSCVLYYANRPVAIWLICLYSAGESGSLKSPGSHLKPPKFLPGVSKKISGRLSKACYRFAILMSKELGQRSLVSLVDSFDCDEITAWHVYAMQKKAVCHTKLSAYIDLNQTLGDILASFRKSYRAIIKTAHRQWETKTISSGDDAKHEWSQLKEMHSRLAGRITRSDDTWCLQYDAICRKQAFVVLIYCKENDQLVGGGYFSYSRDQCSYGVGVYDRTYFNESVSHIVQYEAIKFMQSIGLSSYRFGVCSFSGDYDKPTPKEVSISQFKLGFADIAKPNYILCQDIGEFYE